MGVGEEVEMLVEIAFAVVVVAFAVVEAAVVGTVDWVAHISVPTRRAKPSHWDPMQCPPYSDLECGPCFVQVAQAAG